MRYLITFVLISLIPIALFAQWKSVAAGRQHSMAIKSDNTVWAWGRNKYGELGNNTYIDTPSPVQVALPTGNWLFIEMGAEHSVAIKSDGTLWTWGRNNYGQLGDGTVVTSNKPAQIKGGGTWISASVKGAATLAIKSDGTLWGWGSIPNSGGSTNTIKEPVQIGTSNSWASINLGFNHAIGIQKDGSLWAWGANTEGQLGDGTTAGYDVPKKTGNVNSWAKISAGEYHSIALKTDGTLWVWGDNYFGQLGIGSTNDALLPTQVGNSNKWISIAAGWDHSFAIDNNNNLWGWGRNGGRLGNGTANSSNIPILCGSAARQVSGGDFHSIVLNTSGQFCGTGENSYGELGTGSTSTIVNKLGCATVGTGEVELPFHFDIFPNPGSAWVQVSAEFEGSQHGWVSVRTIDGRQTHLIGFPAVSRLEQLLNIQQLPPGLYIVEVQTDKGKELKKLIIHH